MQQPGTGRQPRKWSNDIATLIAGAGIFRRLLILISCLIFHTVDVTDCNNQPNEALFSFRPWLDQVI